MKFSALKAPNTYLIISSIIVLVAILTWVIPAGEFEKKETNGKTVVINGTYHEVEKNPQGIEAILTAPINGFIDAAAIIAFVLLVGGAFGVFQKTEAVEAGIMSIAKAYKRSAFVRKSIIPLFMIIFSLGGAIFGMSEEVIPFILFFVPLAIMLGYDSITGVAIPFVGAGAGFAGAFINPFTLGIAQGIAELPPLSGMEYRIIVWIFTTSTAIIFVSIYAAKIKKDPQKSIVYEIDKKKRDEYNTSKIDQFTGLDRHHKHVLWIFLAGLAVLVFGVLQYQWFIKEICAVFLVTGMVVGIVGRLSIDEITESFIDGARQLIGTALIIALARGIFIVADDGKIVDTILFALSGVIEEFHPVISSHAMFLVQSFLNFFVPSGSGQAALTMPIMAPLSDLVGVSRQTAVLAYQFGDGFSNLIIPTSAITMGVLSLAGIPWEKWARWMFPLQIIFMLLGFLLLIPPFILGW
ncbi:MAG: C4-dicarboxylate ABC transporter [Melioribacteraceae bacterium]|nr:MAG: C4-dicarboxylate ABC transporter [Melioribacteraceae bacterium]